MAQVLSLGQTLRAPGTLRTYNGHWKAFSSFCTNHGLQALPATDVTTSIYLMELHNRGTPWQTITAVCAAISFAHQLADAPSPTQGTWTSRVREHAKRHAPRPVRAKHPLSLTDIHNMCSPLLRSADIRAFQKGVVLLLMYAAFLRFSDLAGLRWEDMFMDSQGVLWLYIRQSKTDQYHRGAQVPVAPVHGPFCPVQRVHEWLTRSGINCGPPGPLFRSFKGTPPQLTDRAPSYSMVRSWCLSAAAAAGIDPTTVGTHSLRKSAATAAANSNVPAHLSQALGRWRSAASLDFYVTPMDPALVDASRALHTPQTPAHHQAHAATLQRRRRAEKNYVSLTYGGN